MPPLPLIETDASRGRDLLQGENKGFKGLDLK